MKFVDDELFLKLTFCFLKQQYIKINELLQMITKDTIVKEIPEEN
jgi:hypothetical protein